MVEFKRAGNSLIVRLTGEIDEEKAKALRSKIDVEFDEAMAKDMIFDLSKVSFMDSTGIGMIIGRYKRAAALGGSVKVFGADRVVKRIIELSGLGRIVKIYATEEAAVGKAGVTND